MSVSDRLRLKSGHDSDVYHTNLGTLGIGLLNLTGPSELYRVHIKNNKIQNRTREIIGDAGTLN
jgi:prenyltransferase beta subunit